MFDTRAVLVLLTVFGITYSSIIRTNICEADGVNPLDDILPDVTNCSRFYKCDNSQPVLFDCPENLHFNPVAKLCDWAEFAGCNSTQPAFNVQNRNYGLPECPEHEPNQPAVHLPHPTDCSKFYQCDWRVPYLLSCPEGLHFSAFNQVCDFPERANCQSDQNQNQTTTSIPA